MNLAANLGFSLPVAITVVALSACGSFSEGGGGSAASSGSGSTASGGGSVASSGNGGATSSGSGSGGVGGSGGSGSGGSGSGGAGCQPATLLGALSTADGWQMAALDPATGGVTTLGPIPSASGFLQGGSTYDPATKRLYLLGEAANQPTVFTIDGATGATLGAAALPDPSAMNPEVVSAGTIVVLRYLDSDWETATLDPSAGTFTSLSPIPSGAFSADHAFDPSTNRVFVIRNINGAGSVATLDGTTGAQVVDVPTADLQFNVAVVNGAGDIRGLHLTASGWSVADLDPSTGAVTDLAPVSLTGVFAGSGTFDPCTDRIYALTPDGVLTIEGSSGAVISLVALPTEQENFAAIEAVW